MIYWLEQLRDHYLQPMVLVTVARVRGSAPREVGANMLVTPSSTLGTIGGGQLEYQCEHLARDYLADNVLENSRNVRSFPLGTNCGQCCGGVVDVIFERMSATKPQWCDSVLTRYERQSPVVVATALVDDPMPQKILYEDGQTDLPENQVSLFNECRQLLSSGASSRSTKIKQDDGPVQWFLMEAVVPARHHVVVFGAGHVGSALVSVLAKLDCHIHWIDSRHSQFPSTENANVTQRRVDDPTQLVREMPAGAICLVMTHSHALDFDLCAQILRRDDYRYCGLIGSSSKRKRFESLMRQIELPLERVKRLTCPIGVDGVSGKRPEEIAIAVAAQVLGVMSATQRHPQESLHAAIHR